MERASRQMLRGAWTIALCIVTAILCRNIGRGMPWRALSLVRSMIYVGLLSYWGISVRRRVMQTQVRRLLTAIAVLMVFWMAERTVKFLFVTDVNAMRFLWYCYYLPMLLIPFLSVLVAASLGKPENYRLPRWTKLLYLPVAALVLLVLTNDFHQLVFAFPADTVVWTDGEYSYRAGYFVAAGCMGLCALTAVGLMLFKCRGRKGRKTVWLPPILILLCGIYCVLYVLKISDHTSLLFYLAGDLTAALCLMFAGTLESCLQAGLIASNTGYEGLFRVVSVGIRIVDKTGNTHYASETAQPLSREELVRAERGETLESGALRIKALPIRGGYAVWQEDVAELMRVQAELNEIREELQDRNELLRDQYRQDAQRYRLEEQNRLYDLVQRETQSQLKAIDALAERFAAMENGSPERRKMLLRILTLATYIKRHKDMVISADRSDMLPVRMLEGALRESCSNLSLEGVEGNLYIPPCEALLPVDAALGAYDLFEEALECALDSLRYFLVTVIEEEGALCLKIHFECGADLSALRGKEPLLEIEQDETDWFLTRRLTTGGGEG